MIHECLSTLTLRHTVSLRWRGHNVLLMAVFSVECCCFSWSHLHHHHHPPLHQRPSGTVCFSCSSFIGLSIAVMFDPTEVLLNMRKIPLSSNPSLHTSTRWDLFLLPPGLSCCQFSWWTSHIIYYWTLSAQKLLGLSVSTRWSVLFSLSSLYHHR